jgi:glutathione peroxidase
MMTSQALAAGSIYEFSMKTIDGKQKSLSDYKGKVVLIVNVASMCGYTRQYAGLEQLYKKYKDKGFMIAGFPANDFGAQEPGTDQEIKEFCSKNYNVSFDMYGKISVKGSEIHPLYKYLTANGGEIGWNFEKVLIGKDGKIVKRYKSRTEPGSDELAKDIELALSH